MQARNPDRVNISIDGKYKLSLDVFQVTELGIRVGNEIDEAKLAELESESAFGKLYARALEYTLIRPHSGREIRDYLRRKTMMTRYKSRTGEIREREGVSQAIADKVYQRLIDRGYIDDEAFTAYWLANRNYSKGSSRRKLIAELRSKGVEQGIIESALPCSTRDDETEIDKIIAKKRSKYDDDKLKQYLARQGFSYDLITSKISES
jgi:regulatory protein